MGLIGIVVLGLIAGLVARMVKPGDDQMGLVMTAVLGICGAFAMTKIGQSMGWYGPDDAAGFIGAFVGAFLILMVIGFVRARAQRP